MKKKITSLIRSPFVKGVSVMASGTASAQAIGMALSPIITRLYGPEAYGLMGAFMAVVGFIAPIAALSYPIAIVLPKNDHDAVGLIRISIMITAILSIISFIIIIFLNEQIVNLFNLNKIASYLFLIPLIIMFAGLLQVAEQWLIRTKQFIINARVTFLQSLILNGTKVGVGLIKPVAAVLVILSAIGDGLRAALLILFTKRSNSKIKKQNQKTELKKLAMKYKDFPIYRAPQVFLNAITQNLPVLFLTSYFGPISVGLYSIGRTVLSIPTRLIGKAVGDVFYPRISEAAHNKENLTAMIKKATLALSIIGIFPFGIIVLIGPILFSFVFGSDWYEAGKYARWTAIWVYFMFINQPSIRSLPVLKLQRFHLLYTIISVVGNLLSLSLGYYIFNDDLIAIALFSVTGAIFNISLIIITINISKSIN